MDKRTAAPRELTGGELDNVVGGISTGWSGIGQVLSIGSQSSGASAGKVTFNPFSITRKIEA
jgi:hypothetical protein